MNLLSRNLLPILFILSIITIIIQIGCTEERRLNIDDQKELNIDGHWHLNSNGTSYRYKFFLDIKDSVALTNKNVMTVSGGWYKVDKIKKTMLQSGNGKTWKTLFKYSMENDVLTLRNIADGSVITGVRHDVNNCKFESDYYAGKTIQIELPKSNKEDLKLKRTIFGEIILGKPGLDHKKEYGDSMLVETRKKVFNPMKEIRKRRNIIGLDDLLLINQITKNRFFKSYEQRDKDRERERRKQIGRDADIEDREPWRFIIHADKETPVSELAKILEIQNSIEESNIYLVCKRDSTIKNVDDLRMIKLNEEELAGSTGTIEEWLLR